MVSNHLIAMVARWPTSICLQGQALEPVRPLWKHLGSPHTKTENLFMDFSSTFTIVNIATLSLIYGYTGQYITYFMD